MPAKRRSRTSAGAPPAKRAKSKWSRSKFGQVMEEAGLLLGEGDQENLLRVDPAVFQRKVAGQLKKTPGVNVITVDVFMESFREYLDSPTRFKSTLMPTGIAEGADIRVRFGGLDSLMRMLLGVDILQPSVMDALLEWLPDYMSDGAMGDLNLQDYLLMPKLMLSQLRMLDHLVNGKDLCDKLLEVVEIAPHEMKREIITALPDILDDPQHNDVAQKLKGIMETNSDLTAAIVDALSNLNMANDIAAEALDVAINSLQSAHISDLPTVIKFINEHVTVKNAEDVISEVREKLNLDFCPTPIISSTPMTQLRQDSKSSDYFVVLDTIRSSICFQKAVADGWIKAINAVPSIEEHRVIDIFVLFVLYSVTAHKKTVEKMFIGKIKAGSFSEDLMNSVFGSHPDALHDFFSSILQLCECLLCSPSLTVSRFASTLYQHLFTSFEDKYCRQSVVDALVVHINNGVKLEVDQALDVLLSLLEMHCKSVLSFVPLIKTMLDYLGHFTMSQIRKLYQVFSILAFADLDNASALQTELHNIIRKQLTHFEPRYRRIGVIGSVMIIHEIARHSDMCEVVLKETASSLEAIRKRRQDMARQVLEEAIRTCSHSQQCSILFCDEMCLVVSELDSSILEYLCEEITSSFQDTFLAEVAEGVPRDTPVSMEFLYGLDCTEEGSIALNLLPMIMAKPEEGGVAGETKLLEMAAKFHLLRTCEQRLNNSLEGIDALLGCPVLMCSEQLLSRESFEDLPEAQRCDICLSIFYCINWFRELVCAFAMETEIEMRGKVMVRLQNITDLQDMLEKCMTATPGFWPPSASMSEETLSSFGRSSRSSKNDVTLASMTAAAQSIDKDATAMDKTPTTPSVPIDKLRPYFRELDLSVFKVFHFGCLSRTILDSEAQTREQEELHLKPSQLIFLLQDLCTKLASSFMTFGPKIVKSKSDSAMKYSSGDLVRVVTELMPALCEHLEGTSSYFQAQINEHDGVMDAGGTGSEYPQRCLCFHLLLKALYSFFNWSSLTDPCYSEELKTCLGSIVSRTNPASSQISSQVPQMAYGACKYLQRLTDFLPTLSCGHALAKLLVAICKTCKAAEIKPFISRACGSMLQRPWKAAENSTLKKEALCFLLKYHIEWASEPLVVVGELVRDASGELIGEDAVEASEKYPTMTGSTFPFFYRTMMNSLVNQLKSIPSKTQTDLDKLNDHFYTLQVSIKVFASLVNLVQSFSKKAVLLCVLKVGRTYIEAFIKSGMPILNVLFRPKKDDVIKLLKTLQQSTRYMQHCCGHSKVAKDTNLVNNVPQLKKSLETLLFRVKELMANHHCQDAFWVGNLKNRDLKGQEILSQASQQPGNNNDDESDEEGSESTGVEELLNLDSEESDED